MISKKYSKSIQDYLKYIFELSESGQPASTNDLADCLGVAPASVTGMVQKLAAAKPPLVNYRKHQGVTLTDEGLRVALEIIRHHRLLETWLVKSLGYSWDEVHEEACRMEHVISEDFEARIAAALGHPSRDPHGELIPSADLQMPRDTSIPLSTLRPPQKATIIRVDASDSMLLRHLNELGLTPGAQIWINNYSAFDENLTIQFRNLDLVIGPGVTDKIFVEMPL
jgi:DtxR family Mn-dependent transcriptional regulator